MSAVPTVSYYNFSYRLFHYISHDSLMVCACVCLRVCSEWTSVMGSVAYVCCVLLILYATVTTYRVCYFINSTLMTIAIPTVIVSAAKRRRASASDKQKDE